MFKTILVVSNNEDYLHHWNTNVKNRAEEYLGPALKNISPHLVKPCYAMPEKFDEDLKHKVVGDQKNRGVGHQPVLLITVKAEYHFFFELIVELHAAVPKAEVHLEFF